VFRDVVKLPKIILLSFSVTNGSLFLREFVNFAPLHLIAKETTERSELSQSNKILKLLAKKIKAPIPHF
jgi:hypothetical protein